MNNDLKYIDELFRKEFSRGRVNVPDTNKIWWKINSRISRIRFKTFGFKHFNVYYSFMIVTTFIIGMGLAIDQYVLNNNKIDELENQNIPLILPEIDDKPIKGKGIAEDSIKNRKMEFIINREHNENKTDPLRDNSLNKDEPDNKQTLPEKLTGKKKASKPVNHIKVDDMNDSIHQSIFQDRNNSINKDLDTLSEQKNIKTIHKTIIVRDTVYIRKKK